MGEIACPEDAALVEYASGRGTDALRQEVFAHLAHCPRCRFIAASLGDAAKSSPRSTMDTEGEAISVAGSHLGYDIDQPDLADAETRLQTTPEDVESRFNFRLLEAPRDPAALGHLGKYTILQVLGYGGMGVVFRAHDEQLLRIVALKVMSRDLASSPTARRRFIREARAAAAINHPNVVTIHAVEEHNGTPFLVMEFIRGESLRDRLRHGPRLSIVDVLRVSSQVAAGLVAANAHGVIHRDIKPGNIMLEEGLQRVKITDFGLARVAVDNVDLTSRERGIGTPAYMSPEQVRGDEIDARSDLFAFGCVMYAMIRGHSPFQGKTTLEIAHRVADGAPEPPIADAAVPRFLSEIIERLLEKSPKKRFQSASEVAELLRQHLAIINQTPTDKLDQVLNSGSFARPRHSRGWQIAMAAALVVLVGVGFATWRYGFQDKGQPETIMGSILPTGNDSAVVPAETDPKRAQTPKSAVEVTVSQGDGGQYRTIGAALEQAGPGSTIRILDGGEYRESLAFSGREGHSRITIEGVGPTPPTLIDSEEIGAVVMIDEAPGIVLRNLKIRQTIDKQHAVHILGASGGVTLDRVVLQGESRKFTLLHVQGARGEGAAPIVIQNSQFDSPTMCIVAEALSIGEPVQHLHLLGNRFSGNGTHLQLNVAGQNLRAIGNIFEGGFAVIVDLRPASDSSDVTIANNTFFRNRSCLNLRTTSSALPRGVIANNLILENGIGTIDADQPLADFAAKWAVGGNHWELSTPMIDEAIRSVVEIHNAIDVLSRKSASADFLCLATPLPPAHLPELDLLPYVGALPVVRATSTRLP